MGMKRIRCDCSTGDRMQIIKVHSSQLHAQNTKKPSTGDGRKKPHSLSTSYALTDCSQLHSLCIDRPHSPRSRVMLPKHVLKSFNIYLNETLKHNTMLSNFFCYKIVSMAYLAHIHLAQFHTWIARVCTMQLLKMDEITVATRKWFNVSFVLFFCFGIW